MFKLKFKTIAIAAVIASLLLIGSVVKSEAIEITWMTASGADDLGSGAYCYAYITTDEGINYVDWSVEDKDGSVVYEYTSFLSGSETNAMDAFTLSGDISGADYTIKAVAWHIDENANYLSDNKSYNLTIYAPISKSVPDDARHLPFVDGYVQINRHTIRMTMRPGICHLTIMYPHIIMEKKSMARLMWRLSIKLLSPP